MMELFISKILKAISIASYSEVVRLSISKISIIENIDPVILANIESVTYRKVINTPAQCEDLINFIRFGTWQDINLPVVVDFSTSIRNEILNCISTACNEILQVPYIELQTLIASVLPASEPEE